jgi:hypothetical protein
MALAAPSAQAGIACANGQSSLKNAKAAGAEAAAKARAALGDAKPKIVLVFYSDPLMTAPDKVVEGVASVFDKDLIHGCGAYATVTQDSNDAPISVLALGGDVEVTTAVAETAGKDDDANCGKKIGEQLKAAAAKGPGKVLLLFGACHIPRNAHVTKGVCSVLGETFPIVGAAAYKDDILVKGELTRKSNIGILVTGKFSCGFGMKKDMSKEGLISSASDVLKSAIGGKKASLVLVFDCGGRRGAMKDKHKNFPEELAAMKSVAGDSPIFGFYGSGEMGCARAGEAPKGDGYHIAACAIIE